MVPVYYTARCIAWVTRNRILIRGSHPLAQTIADILSPDTYEKIQRFSRIPAGMAVNAGTTSSFSSAPKREEVPMPKNSTQYHYETEGDGPDGTKIFRLSDGTRIVTSPLNDIKRSRCGGIDVHKNILMAAACITDKDSLAATFYVKKFSTANEDIRKMSQWFSNYGVADVCMESTGKYWIPVFDILEQKKLAPTLTHPKYVKPVRGKKTDFQDAMNIANLFRLDAVRASFIPPSDIRDLRELCRYRLKLTYMRTAEKNRYQNSMTISKVRLDSVFKDPFGKSASSIMSYLISTPKEEVDDNTILSFVDKHTKASPQEILDSIHGYEFIGVQRDKLEIIGEHLDEINKHIDEVDEKLEYYRQKYKDIIRRLVAMPGISMESALYILGEIGTDMSVWRDDKALSSWSGLSTACNESARKKKTTKIGKGGHYLKPLLVQCALAAIKSTKKQPYFYLKYNTIKKRRGHKKAIIAIARKMLVAIYHMIKEGKEFQPIDYEQVVTRKHSKELNSKKVIEFLREQGVDDETIRKVEEQCSQAVSENTDAEPTADNKNKKNTQQKKQSKSGTETTPTEQKPAKRRGRPPKSRQTKDQPLDQPVDATA